MKRFFIASVAVLAACGILIGCSSSRKPDSDVQGEPEAEKENVGYKQITQAEAKSLMDSETDYIILDVREQYEFDGGHIENAILIPHTEISSKAEALLTDKSQLILVYCRSGRRSKIAAQALADMGYTNVREFGGINDWQYGTVTD